MKTAGGRHEQQLKAAHLEPEQETEGENSKWHESFETSKLTSNTILPARSHFLNLYKQPPTADQVFKCPRLLGEIDTLHLPEKLLKTESK